MRGLGTRPCSERPGYDAVRGLGMYEALCGERPEYEAVWQVYMTLVRFVCICCLRR